MSGNRGTRLTIAGLVAGIVLGLCYQTARNYAAHELVALLESEVAASCDCRFALDSIDVSLIRMRAVAKRARIVHENRAALLVDELTVAFSLQRLRDRQIWISQLRLRGGHAEGIGPESPTYHLIENLAKPLPPELDHAGRWKLKLRRLTVDSLSFEEQLGALTLRGEGGELDMIRDARNNFELGVAIQSLGLRAGAVPVSGLPDGTAEARLYLADEAVTIRSLRHTLGRESKVEGQAVIPLEGSAELEGAFLLTAAPADFGAGGALSGILVSEAQLSGPTESPSVRGTLRAPDGAAITPGDGGGPIVFETFEAGFRARLGDQVLFAVESLRASGPRANLTLAKPLVVHDGRIESGALGARVEEIALGGLSLAGISAELTASGPVDSPLIEAKGAVDATRFGTVLFPKLELTARRGGGTLVAALAHAPDEQGALSVEISRFPANGGGAAHELLARAESLRVLRAVTGAQPRPVPLILSGTLNATAPGDLRALEGAGTVSLVPAITGTGHGALFGTIEAAGGKLEVLVHDATEKLAGVLKLDLFERDRSALRVTLDDYPMGELLPEVSCVNLSAELHYRFAASRPESGEGSLGLSRFGIGCESRRIALESGREMPIRNGVLDLSGFALAGPNTDIRVNGRLGAEDGLALDVTARVDLEALLGVVTSFDSLDGMIEFNAGIRGKPERPEISGALRLSDVSLTSEAANVRIERLNGTLDLAGDHFTLDSVGGTVNTTGSFRAAGELHPFDLRRSAVELEFDDVYVAPTEGIDGAVSGRILLAPAPSGRPRLSGAVLVERGELRESFDVPSILTLLLRLLSDTSRAAEAQQELPEIELDVAVGAERNLFILTNVANAELQADLRLGGTLRDPVVDGELTVIGGWIGFRRTRFEITSGTVTFKGRDAEPVLDLLGETYIPSRELDDILVMIEAQGPMTAPRLVLSSDRGLSEQEILRLLTAGIGSNTLRTRANTITTGFEDESGFLFERETVSNLWTFLSRLTRIDSLLIVPSYNIRTGSIEPTLTAEKRLSRDFSLIGESSIGSIEQSARLRAIYDLTERFSVNGIVEADATRDVNPVEGNAVLTVLSRKSRLLEIRVEGHEHLDRDELLRSIRLNELSRVAPAGLGRLRDRIVERYRDEGFFEARADIACETRLDLCSKLRIEIHEGPESPIDSVKLRGDSLPELVPESAWRELLEVPRRERASTRFLAERSAALTRALRSEGYLGARVEQAYEEGETPGGRRAVFTLTAGSPVSFVFRGSTVFSDAELLESIDLFGRRQPFGNNTINILVENIERDYRRAGYLYATIGSTRTLDAESGRVVYLVEIDEGAKVGVESVELAGEPPFGRSELEASLEARYEDETVDQILSPRFAVAEQLDAGAAAIQAVLAERGFSEASVTHSLVSGSSADKVIVRYTVLPGEQRLVSRLRVESWPAGIDLPAPPTAPAAVAAVNGYLDELLAALRESGYRSAALTALHDSALSDVVIRAAPGEPTRVGTISVLGAERVRAETVRRTLRVKAGELWNERLIREDRRRLFNLGLFARVDVAASDGAIDEPVEDLEVRVLERPLNTLELGAGANSEFGAHIFGEATDRSLFRDGRFLALRADLYYDPSESDISQGVGSIRYSDPLFLESGFGLAEDLRYQKFELSTYEYDLDRLSLASYLYRPEHGVLNVSFGHTILLDDLSNVSQDAVLSDLDQGNVRLSFLSGTATYDKRDDPLNPTRGYALSADYAIALSALASEADYHSIGTRFSAVTPFSGAWRRYSFGFNARAASAWAFGDTSDIPITQRYYLGGRTTVRGFRENSLGPLGAEGSVIGGDLLLLSNLELRYRFTDQFSSHVFLDSGSVFLKDRSVGADDLRYSTGFGVRYLSPFGPIGLDLGHPLDERGGEPSVRVHFTIGSLF